MQLPMKCKYKGSGAPAFADSINLELFVKMAEQALMQANYYEPFQYQTNGEVWG